MAIYRPLVGIPSADHDPSPGDRQAIYSYRASYIRALAAAGAAPIVIPLHLPDETLASIFRRLDGLCLAGGVDVDPAHYGEEHHAALGKVDAARDETELLLTQWALASEMPVLGICRGVQLLNVVAGGSLYQDLAAQVQQSGRHDYSPSQTPWERPTQSIHVDPASLLCRSLGADELRTNSFHHQAVKDVAPGFCRGSVEQRRHRRGHRVPAGAFRGGRAVASRGDVRHRSGLASPVRSLRRRVPQRQP